MQDTSKMFIIGVTVTVLVLKPAVGLAFFSSVATGIGNVAEALHEPSPRREKEKPEPVVLANGNEEFQMKTLTLFERIIDKLDRMGPREEIVLDAPKAAEPKEEPKSKVKDVVTDDDSEKVTTKQFDKEYSHKFTLR